MAIQEVWNFDHCPLGAGTDLSAGTSLSSYSETGTYNTVTGLIGQLYKNTYGTGIITADAFLQLTSGSGGNAPALVVPFSRVQDWTNSTQYWVGFRTKFIGTQSPAAGHIFALTDTYSWTNMLALLSESDMTAAGAATVNTEYYVEIFLDRVALTYQVLINGTQIKSGTMTAAQYVSTGSFIWGTINSAGTNGASRSFKNFYFLNVDATTPGRLGSIKSSLAVLASALAPNYTSCVASLIGTAAISTTQSKFGGASLQPGSTYGVQIPDSTALRQTGDFTIEGWYYVTSTSTNQALFGKALNGSAPYGHVAINAGALYAYADGSAAILQPSLANASSIVNTWVHFAYVRSGNVWSLYQNGALLGSYTGAGTFGNNAAPFSVGGWGGGTVPFLGYIDEFRISNVARYTAAFTPQTTPFVADANTLALMHFDAAFSGAVGDAAVAPLTVLGTGFGTVAPTALPNVVSAATNDALSLGFAQPTGAILAMDFRVAAQGPGASPLAGKIQQGSNNLALPTYTFPDTAMAFGRRLALSKLAADGAVWTPAKLAASQLVLTPGNSPVSKTLLLLHFDGANGQTTTTDATALNTPTMVSGAALSTAQSKFGSSSLQAGSGQGVQIPDSTALRLTGDFTIEGWFYFTSFSNNQVMFSKAANASAPYNHVSVNASAWYAYPDNASSAFTPAVQNASTSLNTWIHMAFQRQGNTWSLYQNGVLVGSVTSATYTDFGNNAGSFDVGGWPNGNTFQGYIDEFRISNVARYSGASFAVPTAPFALD